MMHDPQNSMHTQICKKHANATVKNRFAQLELVIHSERRTAIARSVGPSTSTDLLLCIPVLIFMMN